MVLPCCILYLSFSWTMPFLSIAWWFSSSQTLSQSSTIIYQLSSLIIVTDIPIFSLLTSHLNLPTNHQITIIYQLYSLIFPNFLWFKFPFKLENASSTNSGLFRSHSALPAAKQQLLMAAVLRNHAIVQHGDLVRHAHRGEAMTSAQLRGEPRQRWWR